MASHKPAYRLRVYAPRSTDPAEATILTPAAGAPHADEFKVASIDGVAGYKPYLADVPMGRRGRLDLLNRKLDVGTLSFLLIDKRTGTVSDNLTRWVSAFFGDVKGKPPGRLKVEADESLDGGVTWPAFAVMELVKQQLMQKVGWRLDVHDRVELLKMKTFVGQPSASLTYVAHPTLCPIGFRGSEYGKLKTTPAFTGKVFVPTFNGANYTPSGEIFVLLDTAAMRDLNANILTQNLVEALAPNTIKDAIIENLATKAVVVPNFSGVTRCHLKRLDTNAEGDFRVGGIQARSTNASGNQKNPKYIIMGFFLQALSDNDVGYMAVPPAATNVEVHLYIDGPISEERPLLIADVDPATYIQDVCAGKFGYLYRAPDLLPAGKAYGDPMRSIPTNGVAAFVGTRPPMRLPVTKESTAIAEIERVCLENHWAPFLDKQARLNLVDLRLPSTLAGVPTITDDDVDETDDVDWEHDPTAAILRLDLTQYSERVVTNVDLANAAEEVPRLSGTALLKETAHKLEPLYIGSIDYGDRVHKIDAKGYRSMEGEQYQNQARSAYIENALFELGHQLQRPFAYGTSTIPLRCKRTATVSALIQGQLVICNASVVPDPATHKRGGSRVCRVLEISEDGQALVLRLIDLAFSAIAAVPTIGAPEQEANNTYTGVTVAVTLNASNHPVEVQYAVTETAVGVAPVDGSALWTIAGYKTSDRGIHMARGRRTPTSAIFAIRGVPPGKRIWVRGRSFAHSSVEPQLPSPWVAAAAPGYVDTAALTAPNTLAATKTHKTATLTWVNGSSDLAIEILLATPVGDARRRVHVADPGSTRFELTDLEPSTTYRAEVRHTLGEHVSAGDTEDFTTDAAGAAAPDIKLFQILEKVVT